MRSPALRIERARPLLGTTVAIRVQGLGEAPAHRAIDEAFDEVALVHRLMSFQEPDSEISRLNRDGFARTQDLHPATFEVLHWAREIAEASEGRFDITIAPKLVAWGSLPAPQSDYPPDARGSWRDIELSDDYRVRFRRPLWVDLSGIAKGYAVDRAIEKLQRHGAAQASVNAGGDLRIYGPESERIQLRTEEAMPRAMPLLEIQDAAIASSLTGQREGAQGATDHCDPATGQPISPGRFATVVAQSCLIADALTKPVLILQERSELLLRRFGASAHLHDTVQGWRHVCGNVG
jgi:thiamine biosynthesis lipoprotein